MALFTIDQDECTQCGACVDECPVRLVYMKSEDDYPRPVPQLVELCLSCGHCASVCPTGAFALNNRGADTFTAVDKKLNISPEQAWQFLCARRSIRTYEDKPVSRETLQALIDVACRAASAKNEQPWRWIVVEKTEELRKISAMVIEWMKMMVDKFPDDENIQALNRPIMGWNSGYDIIGRGAPHLIMAHADKAWPWAVQDCSIALAHMDLYSTSIGLGACWAGYITGAANQYPPLKELLGLPEGNIAAGALMVGYPTYGYVKMPDRNAPQVEWI